MALICSYSMRLAIVVLLNMFISSVLSQDDCMRFYRRDMMEIWRVPKGSGLCNITANCSDIRVTAQNLSLQISSNDGNTTLSGSFATYRHYSGKNMSVLLDLGRRTPYLIFQVVQNASYAYSCNSNIDDTGLGFTKYTLNIREGDIIFEGQGLAKIAYFIQFFTMLAFLVISFTKTDKFYCASVGYPVFLISWILFTGIFEITTGVFLFGLLVISCATYGAIHAASKKISYAQTEVAIWLNIILSGFLLIRCSYCAIFISTFGCIYMLITYCCLKPSLSTVYDRLLLSTMTNKIREGNAFMATWLISLFFQIDAPLPLFFEKYVHMDRAYPTAPGIMILVGDILVGPILCLCIGGLVFIYARRFKNQLLTPNPQNQGYFAPPEYPIYGQPPQPNADYQNQYPGHPSQPIGYPQANPFM